MRLCTIGIASSTREISVSKHHSQLIFCLKKKRREMSGLDNVEISRLFAQATEYLKIVQNETRANKD